MSTMVLTPQAAPHVRRPANTRPGRTSVHAVRGRVASCVVQRPAQVGWMLRLKVAAIATLGVVGMGVSVAEFASWSEVDPAVEVVHGDPAWAHVGGR